MGILRKTFSLLVLVVVLILTGCSVKGSKVSNTQPVKLEPQEVIKEFFKYYNEKDLKGIHWVTTTRYHSSDWGFDNLDYIKFINIVEDKNTTNKEIYLRAGKKNQIIDTEKEKEELENVAIFTVDFEVKYKKEGVGPRDSGKDRHIYILTRESKNSPWLIDSFGY